MNKYCPSCGAEYRPGFTHCSDCGVELTDEPPDPNKPSAPVGRTPLEYRGDLVEIYRSNPMDSHFVKSMLESNGIATVVKESGSSSMYPVNVGALGESIVMVVRDDAPVARELIELTSRAEMDDDQIDSDDYEQEDYGYYEPGFQSSWRRAPFLTASIALMLAVLLFILYARAT